jgi:hypothetical protein
MSPFLSKNPLAAIVFGVKFKNLKTLLALALTLAYVESLLHLYLLALI